MKSKFKKLGKMKNVGKKQKNGKQSEKKTFYNRGPPKHQDTQLGSKNLPQ